MAFTHPNTQVPTPTHRSQAGPSQAGPSKKHSPTSETPLQIPPPFTYRLPRAHLPSAVNEYTRCRMQREHEYLNAVRRRFFENPNVADWLRCTGPHAIPLPRTPLTSQQILEQGDPDRSIKNFTERFGPIGIVDVKGASGITSVEQFQDSFNFEIYGSEEDDLAMPQSVAETPFPKLGDVGELYHCSGVVDGFALGSIATKCKGHPLSHVAERVSMPGWRRLVTRRIAACITSDHELQSIEVTLFDDGRCLSITRATPMLDDGRFYGISDILFMNSMIPPTPNPQLTPEQRAKEQQVQAPGSDIASEFLFVGNAPTPAPLDEVESSSPLIMFLREATLCKRCCALEYVYCMCPERHQDTFDCYMNRFDRKKLCPTIIRPDFSLEWYELWKVYMHTSTKYIREGRLTTVMSMPRSWEGQRIPGPRMLVSRVERTYTITKISRDCKKYVQKEIHNSGFAFPHLFGGSFIQSGVDGSALAIGNGHRFDACEIEEVEDALEDRATNTHPMLQEDPLSSDGRASFNSFESAQCEEAYGSPRSILWEQRDVEYAEHTVAAQNRSKLLPDMRFGPRSRDVSRRQRDEKGRFLLEQPGNSQSTFTDSGSCSPVGMHPNSFNENDEENERLIERAYTNGYFSRSRSTMSREILDTNVSLRGLRLHEAGNSDDAFRSNGQRVTGSIGACECHICSHKFSRRSNLVRHIRTVHNGERKFLCPACGYRFGHRADLVRHIRTFHEKRTYTCEECQENYNSQEKLNLHTRMVHLNAKKPFECEQCGAGFGRKSSKLRHIASVHNKKRWVCEECNKSYSQKFDCDKHRRQEHGWTGPTNQRFVHA